MSDRKRRKIMMDWGRWQTVLKHTRQSSKPSTVAVLVAMENVCFEQRSKHGGNAFVGSYPFLATMSGVHEDTVRNVVQLLEELKVIEVTQNYDVRRKQYSENYYRLLLIGGGSFRGGVEGGVMESEQTSESVALSKEKGEASKCPPLALRHLDATHKNDKEATMAAKQEAAAKYKAEQLAAAEERKRQEEAELAERKERERLEREQRLERLRLATEKEKADKEAAQLAEDARRLARRSNVGNCRQAIMQASFGFYDPSWSHDDPQAFYLTVWKKYNSETVMATLKNLAPDWTEKVKACIRECEYIFHDAPRELTVSAVVDHAADHGHDHVSADPRSPSTS